jgi:hypothetical protein
MGVIEGIREILAGAPRQLVFNVRMKVLFDSLIGLVVIALQGQEIVATLLSYLGSNGGLTTHGINRHDTACDGE